MSEETSVVCHGKGGFGGLRVGQGQNIERHYYNHQQPRDMAQVGRGGNRGGEPPRQGQKRWQPRRDKQHQKDHNSPFGYESDDSSLSSNASGSNGSNKSSENDGKHSSSSSGSHTVSREWRARNRRDHRPKRIPDRINTAYCPFEVKFAPDDLLNGSQWDNLSQEIWDKFMKSQQTEATFHKKMHLWRHLYGTIRSIFPRYGLYVVGSTMTGFGLESSDMDLCLYVRATGHNMEPRTHALLHLEYMLSFIRAFDPDAELIQAKVPILKFRDEYSGVQVDLNCNNVVGIRNTSMLYAFSIGDWRVRPLVAVVKLWARANCINDARRRTLSSYALTLMVIHFLQCGTNPWVLPRVPEVMCERPCRSQNRLTLGELFLQFLKYYAEFPYDQMAVSVRAGRRIPILECRYSHLDPHQWKHICVEEPFDLTNTARSVYDPETFEKIVKAFRDSFKRLSGCLRLCEAWPSTR